MPIEILMPALGPSMTDGSIARWGKQEGESIKCGDVLVEIETDKAVIEVVSEHDGILGKILVAEGAKSVKVGALIALLATNGENPKAFAAQATPAATHPNPADARRVFASPLARRVAKDLVVDLEKIAGSGPKGRVLKADVERAAAAVQAGPALMAQQAKAQPGPGRPSDFDDIPHSNMRRVIAQRLSESKRSVPHFYLTVHCDMDALLALRKQISQQLDGVKISVNDFIVKATAIALKRHGGINASWTEDAIRRHRDVDISIAVATPGGLMTPILRNADQKSLACISSETRDLAARAKDGKLRPEEFQGGGFTISNLGMYGISEFAAIVNPPQACILAVGACEQRALVRDGEVRIGSQMSCTLSVDHRVVDGALGAEFLREFRKIIETPFSMLV
ncbi:MAG: 2-oxo acid dehydrogenase subunit E2 [Telluria sp.]|nr:2-oxo acid dehydrogenase subunit E2 [Telluria sp.]